jgi:hypothetical protein
VKRKFGTFSKGGRDEAPAELRWQRTASSCAPPAKKLPAAFAGVTASAARFFAGPQVSTQAANLFFFVALSRKIEGHKLTRG